MGPRTMAEGRPPNSVEVEVQLVISVTMKYEFPVRDIDDRATKAVVEAENELHSALIDGIGQGYTVERSRWTRVTAGWVAETPPADSPSSAGGE